jgi:hypothetical protein
VRLYLLVANPDNGALQAMPFEGGLLDQPHRTMQAFQVMQAQYWEYLGEETERIKGRFGGSGH